jgi:tetratricopeptide (TPR) repeat protein
MHICEGDKERMKKYTFIIILLFSMICFPLAVADADDFRGGRNHDRSANTGSSRKRAYDYYSKGVKFFDKENYKVAVMMFKKSLRYNPNLSRTYVMLGHSLRRVENYNEAVKYYLQALRFSHSNETLIRYVGETYLEAHDMERALQQYERLLKMESPEAQLLKEKIDAYQPQS